VEHLVLRSWRGLSWIWLDDLHLADDSDDAWALVDMILSRGGPVLVLVTTRSDTVSEPFLELQARWEDAIETIVLTPLKSVAASAFIKAHLPIDATLAQRLAHHTGGNPRAMREHLLHWVRTGALEPVDGGPSGEQLWNLRASAPALPADRHAFARERLGHALDRRPDWLGPLLTIALAGRGTPERVVARVAGTSLDELVVEGLVDLQRGRPALSPPELGEAVREWPHPEGLDTLIHEHLAAAWAEEGDDPVVLGRVGMHRAEAGLFPEALAPLDKALRALKNTLPLPEVIRLARRTMDVASSTRSKGDPTWSHAAMALSDALWHVGDGEDALAQDHEIAELVLGAEDAVRAARLHADHLGGEGARESLDRLAGVEPLVHEIPPRERAAFLAMRAWCRTRLLDVDGGLEDTDAAMRSDPDPETMVRCYLSRTMLLAGRDPGAAYESARACIDLAHQEGLVRYETVAWGLCGPWLVQAGRAREAIDRLRSDIARLRARGEYRIVAMLLLTLGEIHRAAGQLDDASMAFEEAAATGTSGAGSLRPAARMNLAVLGALHGDAERIRRARIEPTGAAGSALARSWVLLDRIADLLEGAAVPPLEDEAIEWGVRLGADGVFLCRVTALLLEERGASGEASAVLDRMRAAAREHRVDVNAADDLVRRFIALRPARRPAESRPA